MELVDDKFDQSCFFLSGPATYDDNWVVLNIDDREMMYNRMRFLSFRDGNLFLRFLVSLNYDSYSSESERYMSFPIILMP